MSDIEERNGGTRDRLLGAAMTLFSKRGFDGASTREIAQLASCNVALINHYFGSKEGLLRVAMARGLGALSGMLNSLRSEPLPPREKIGKFVDLVFDHFDRNSDGIRIAHREFMQQPSTLLEFAKPMIVENMETLTAILTEAREAGDLREVDVRTSAVLLMGMVQYYFVAYPLASAFLGSRTPDVLESLKRHVTDIFLNGVLQGHHDHAK